MSTPDVRVRLSPEGIKEVIFAIRQVQAEANKAAKGAGDGVGVVSNAVRELKSLLPTLGLAAIVGGFAALSKQALDTADATGKMAAKMGGTVEEISALTLAFRTNESDQAGLQQALSKTSNLIGDLKAGSPEAAKALGAIGIQAKDIVGLSTPRALELIAQKLAAIPPEGGKASAATKIFSKNAAELLTALDAVGTQGIDPFIDKARKLGVLIDSDLATAAARAKDALGLIKIQAEGLATQFVSGFAPHIAKAMESFSKSVEGDGYNSFQKFADFVGFIIRYLINGFESLGLAIGANIAAIGVLISAAGDAANKAAHLDFSGAKASLKQGVDQVKVISQQLAEDQKKLQDELTDPIAAKPATKTGTGGGGGANIIDENARKAAAAQQAFNKARLENELKLQQEGIKSQQAALDASYAQNLISLAEYFDKRKALLERQNAIELKSLQLQRAALTQQLNSSVASGGPETAADQIKIRQQIAAVDAQIDAAKISSNREIAQLDAERVQQSKALQKEQASAATKLDELENKRHDAFQRNLDQEIQDIKDLGARAGETADEIDAQVKRLVNARTASFNFDEVTRKGAAALASFQQDADQINRDQQSGVITQLEGEQRLIELEKQRLVVLQQLAQQLLIAAEATGSEEQIQKAQQFAASVDQIAASYKQATDVGSMFKSGAVDAFESGIESLLANADKITSVGDAFRSLALSVAQSLQKIAAEILAKQAVLALVRAFGGAGASAGSAAASAAGAKTGGRIRAMAVGGDVMGTALNIPGPDKIPILAQEGEFMMRKARVQEPGALDFLRRWNTGQFSLAQALRFPKYATGGEIGAAKGAPAQAGSAGAQTRGLRIINLVDPGLVTDAMATASGEQTVMNHIERNATTIKRMLQGS